MVEYPVHTRYVICSSQIAATRPVGQAVKTPPFHGGNMGSIPVRVTMKRLPTPLGVGSLFISGLPVRESKRPGGQWPQPISHDSFLRIVTSLTRPVSAACPPNLLHIPFSLFPESARYCYRVEIDAKTQAPLAKGGCHGNAEAGGFRRVAGFHIGLCLRKVPTVNPSVKNQRFLPAPFDKGAFWGRKMGALHKPNFATLPFFHM